MNPYDVERTCEVLVEAIHYPKDRLWKGHRRMVQYVTSHTGETWSRTFLRQLRIASESAARDGAAKLRPYVRVWWHGAIASGHACSCALSLRCCHGQVDLV